MIAVALYRCYDEADQLLYVGITSDLKQRMRLHRSNGRSPWFARVAQVRHEWYGDRVDALLAERIATLTEGPEFPSTVTGAAAMSTAVHALGADARLCATNQRRADEVYADLVRRLLDAGYADDACTPPSSEPFDDDELERRHLAADRDAARRLSDFLRADRMARAS